LQYKAEESTTCSGLTKKKKNCRTAKPKELSGRWYCPDHQSQALADCASGITADTAVVDMKALFAHQSVYSPNCASAAFKFEHPSEPMKVKTCSSLHCDCKEGYFGETISDDMWECGFHRAIRLSSELFVASQAIVDNAEVECVEGAKCLFPAGDVPSKCSPECPPPAAAKVPRGKSCCSWMNRINHIF
jgi:hypothetical protein